MKTQKLLSLILITILLSSCALSNLKKQGEKYYQAGIYELATDSYIKALEKKNTDADAKIGLMKSSALYAVTLEQNIDKHYISGNDDQVVANYIKLQTLAQTAELYQVPVDISERATGEYKEAKNRYIEDYYAQALNAIKLRNYSTANNLLTKISEIDADYKSTKSLLHMSKCEPIYANTISLLKAKDYKGAYNKAENLISIDKNYKDIAAIQKEALAETKSLIMLQYIGNEGRYRNFVSILTSNVISHVNSNKDPLFMMLQESQYNNMVAEWKNKLNSSVETATTDIIPVKTLLKIKVNNISTTTTRLQKEKKKGFIRRANSDKSISYKKIYYYEYSQSKTVSVNLYYTIADRVSMNTKASNSITDTQTDNINYIYYDGKNDINIVSGYWKSNHTPFNSEIDVANDNFLVRSKMRTLARGRKTLTTTADMESKLSKKLAIKLSRAVKSGI